jgi:hypothetical protein
VTTLRVTLKASAAFYLNPFFLSWPARISAWRDNLQGTGFVSVGTPVTTTAGYLAAVYVTGSESVTPARADQLRQMFDGLAIGVDCIGVEVVAAQRPAEEDRKALAGGTITGGVTDALDKVGKGATGILTAAAVVVGLLYLVRNDK